MNFTILVVHEGFSTTTKDIVGLDLRWKYDLKLLISRQIRGQFFGGK